MKFPSWQHSQIYWCAFKMCCITNHHQLPPTTTKRFCTHHSLGTYSYIFCSPFFFFFSSNAFRLACSKWVKAPLKLRRQGHNKKLFRGPKKEKFAEIEVDPTRFGNKQCALRLAINTELLRSKAME